MPDLTAQTINITQDAVSGTIQGTEIDVNVNNATSESNISALTVNVEQTGTGTLDYVFGSQVTVEHKGEASIGNGAASYAEWDCAAGVETEAACFWASANAYGSSTVESLALVEAGPVTITAPAVVTNLYGVKVEDIDGAVNNYGVYTCAGKNSFGDSVEIRSGNLTAPLATPASSSAPGTPGMIQWDAGYIYVCTAPNTWLRAALTTF